MKIQKRIFLQLPNTFSVVNHWVLHGHCDRLRNLLTLFCDWLRTILEFFRTFSGVNCGQLRKKFLAILWFIKETFSLWSITKMSVIDNRPFWHRQSEEINFETVRMGTQIVEASISRIYIVELYNVYGMHVITGH